MRYDDIYFLEVGHVEQAHADAIALAGGDPSVRDAGLIESATMAPRNAPYQSLAEIAAAYAFGIAKNHGFVDGNKRTAVFAMMAFLDINGFPIDLTPVSIWASTIEGVANGSVTLDALADAVQSLIGDCWIDP